MELDKILQYLGEPVTDAGLIKVLLESGIDFNEDVKLNTDSADSYINKKKSGFSLVFTDEAMFLDQSDQVLGKGTHYFTGVFLFSGGKDDYSEYQGEMPNTLKFTDTRDLILEKLGEPSWQRKSRKDKTVLADRWDLSDYRIHITYSKKTCLPTVIAIGLPDKLN